MAFLHLISRFYSRLNVDLQIGPGGAQILFPGAEGLSRRQGSSEGRKICAKPTQQDLQIYI
ncbi:MAG: hypothetical protein K2X08_03720 [Chlamydiales bacterium]|nr:hypothetical protein [Chlamydiales bacterium]